MATISDSLDPPASTGALWSGPPAAPARVAAMAPPGGPSVLSDALALLGADGAALAAPDPATGDLMVSASAGSGVPPQGARLSPGQGIVGWLASHQQPLIVADVSADSRHLLLEGVQRGSVACVPLVEGSALLGALIISSERAGALGPQHGPLLSALAHYATLALQRDRSATATDASARTLATLVEAAQAMTTLIDPREVFANITAGLSRLVDYDDALILAYDEARQELRVIASCGTRHANLNARSVSMRDPTSLSVRVAHERRPCLYAPDLAASPTGKITESFLGGEDLALLCVPLLSKDQLRGVATLARHRSFAPADLHAMTDLAPLIATAIENASLYAAVKMEQEQLAAIFAGTADGLCVVDSGLRIVRANIAFGRLVHRAPAALTGEALETALAPGTLLPEPARTRLHRVLAAVATAVQASQATPLLECEIPGPPGAAPRQALISVAPIAMSSGHHAIVVVHDVTDLREADRMKAQFLQMISHEIRSPLHALSGYLDLAMRAAQNGDTRMPDYLRRARASGRHLVARVKDLLLLAYADSGAFVIEADECDLTRVLKDAIDELHLSATEQGIVVHVKLPPSLPPIVGDRERLGQVARNLLGNAIKFTPHGGHVWIEAHATARAIDFSVTDTGCGIAPEHLPRIFERFFRVPAEQGHTSGQGLGLTIVRTIVERHGGTVEVQSAPGQGSRFIVRLPLLPPDSVPPALGRPQDV
jgi:signal transduction histidine kinase